jgi:hypothetical protein
MPEVFAPTPDADDRYFWDGVAERKLLLQKCSACGQLRQPPSVMCGACNALEWETLEACGRAKVYSWILSRHPTEPDAAPRIAVLLDLEEGVRFVSNLVEIDIDEVRFGMDVDLVFIDYGAQILPQFRPVSGEAR